MELLNDKTAVPVGRKTGDPLARPQLLLAAAVVTAEVLTVPENAQRPPPRFPACRCPSCGPGSLSDELDVGAAHGRRPPRLTPLRAEGLQASPAVRGSLLPRMRRCPVERIFPPCRWELGCLCQSKRPVPAPSRSGISYVGHLHEEGGKNEK